MLDKQKEDFLKSVYKSAFDYERDYGYCTQAVLAALDDHFKSIDKEVIKATQPLAGGGALVGDGTCGGLVGAIAAIGCYFGRSKEEFDNDSEDWRFSSKLAKKVRKKFVEEFGSVICNEVQKEKLGRSYDLWDPEDNKAFNEAGAHEDKCPDVTGKAAKFTAEILLEEGIEKSSD